MPLRVRAIEEVVQCGLRSGGVPWKAQSWDKALTVPTSWSLGDVNTESENTWLLRVALASWSSAGVEAAGPSPFTPSGPRA